MRSGRIYAWIPDAGLSLGGRIERQLERLLRLDVEGEGAGRLWGKHVRVRNGGAVNLPDGAGVTATPIGDARPDAHDGDYLFEPGHGGGRLDKVLLAEPDFRWRYVQASHFGEVNTYFHLDHIAAYVDELLRQLGARSLPRVTAVVTAHHAATEKDGVRDGVLRGERWLPFQGGHYRLPGRALEVEELAPMSIDGEIHLGPGWRLAEHGALVAMAGGRYRANASHNAGIIYHEYGHHLTRHTADFGGSALRPPDRQRNRKPAIDEGTADYLAATMLETPHIWAWHHRHDAEAQHPRSLRSPRTMADYDERADPHQNGTIWGAALWDLRSRLAATEEGGARQADRLLIKALLLLGGIAPRPKGPDGKRVLRLRRTFGAGLAALLAADEVLHGGRHRDAILHAFARRGIDPEPAIGRGADETLRVSGEAVADSPEEPRGIDG